MWASTLCPLLSSTRNIALGRGSTTRPSTSMAPSFFAMSSALLSPAAGSRTPDLQDRERSPGDHVVPLPPAYGCTPDRARADAPGRHGPTHGVPPGMG